MSNLFEVCWMAVEPRYAADIDAMLQSLRARDAGKDAVADAKSDVSDSESRGRRRTSGDGGLWRADEYDAFLASGKESYLRVQAFCDVVAAAEGDRLTLSAASTAAGITPSQLRAALGKFTTWINATIDSKEWPFGWAYGEGIDPKNPIEFHYSMSEEQASAWRAARGRTPELPK